MPPLPKQVRLPGNSAFSAVIPASSSVTPGHAGIQDSGEKRKSRGGQRARLTGLRETLAALEAKHRRASSPLEDTRPAAHPPAPVGIADLDARLGGGLPWGGVHELVTARAGDRTAAAGFALALAARLVARPLKPGFAAASDGGHFLWVYPRRLAQEAGLPYGPGLMAFGHDPGRLLLVEAARSADVLWTVENALAAGPLRAVFALVDETYETGAFTASRRFALAARSSGASVFLLGARGEKLASAAPLRWQVASLSAPARLSSAPTPFPSRTSWRVKLIRNRFGANGTWDLEWNHDLGTFHEYTPHDGSEAAPLAGRTGNPDPAETVRRSA